MNGAFVSEWRKAKSPDASTTEGLISTAAASAAETIAKQGTETTATQVTTNVATAVARNVLKSCARRAKEAAETDETATEEQEERAQQSDEQDEKWWTGIHLRKDNTGKSSLEKCMSSGTKIRLPRKHTRIKAVCSWND